MVDKLRWGILGTGNIARQFCAGTQSCQRGRVVAIASRGIDGARAFAERFGIVSAYGGYDDLFADKAVDAVYVALPNSLHHHWTIRALRAGNHVLCEKPFAANLTQAREMFDEADKAKRVLAEAFMYLSHPQTLAVQEQVRSGAIGELRVVRSSFCFRIRRIEENIRFRPELAGGAMMDVGCYCTSLACLFATDDPVEVRASAKLHPSGVDEITCGALRFKNGLLASFTCGMTVQSDNTAYLCGTEGFIEVPVPWKPGPSGVTYTIGRNAPAKQDAPAGAAPAAPPRQTHTIDAGHELYALEADDFAASVQDGAAPRVSRELTLRNMHILDEIRRQIGVGF